MFFTSHYLVLRGFYALEHTRLVFFIQCVVAAVNIALAYTLTRGISPGQTSPRLVIAYAGAYAVGAVISFVVLSRLVGGLEERTLLRFVVRLVRAAGVAAAPAWGVSAGVHAIFGGDSKPVALLALALAGTVDLVLLALLSRLLRITEFNDVVALVRRRLPVRRGPGRRG